MSLWHQVRVVDIESLRSHGSRARMLLLLGSPGFWQGCWDASMCVTPSL